MASTPRYDAAHKWTDEQLEQLERRMSREYEQAAREMRGKQAKALEKYAKEKSMRERAMEDTPEARRAHKEWLRGQAADQQRMQAMVDDLSKAANQANVKAANMLNNSLPTIFAENANRAAFAIDSKIGRDTAFSLVDESTVRNLMGMRTEGVQPRQLIRETVWFQTQEGQLQDVRKQLSKVRGRHIDYAKDIRWNRQKFTSAITQGILQGESIPHIVKRTEEIFGQNRSAAYRAARTATTAAENAGRVSSYARAQRLGIPIVQEWMATPDDRVRPSHRDADGQRRDVGEYFDVGNARLEYPGDPAGGDEAWNCRCTLFARVKGFDKDTMDRWMRLPEGTTYEQWKAGKAVSRAESYGNEAARVSGTWYAGGMAENMAQLQNIPAPFDFGSYAEGEAITTRDAIIDSLPQEMHDSEIRDYDLGTMSEAEYAVKTMARYTTDEWKRYQYDGYLEKAIQESSKQYEGPMFRGVRMPASRLEELDAGAVIEPQGVQSWSRNHGTALDYCDMRRGGRPTVLVDVTEGKHTALSIEAVSQYSGEAEVLSSGKIRYEIVRKYEKEFEHFSLRRDEPTIKTTVLEVRELRG